jgi:hypothetical protein
MESGPQPVDAFWVSDLFRRVQTVFWIAFIALPIFTGWLAYDWLPNESYDAGKHELLESHEEEHGGRIGDVADLWRDKRTGEVFARGDFEEHRRREARRMAAVCFAYGLIGCFFYALVRSAQKRSSFYEAFGIAVLVNVAVAVLTWLYI